MAVNIVYIDDQVQELKKYKVRFSTDQRAIERFTIETSPPPKSPPDYDQIRQVEPGLLLIDYRLDVPDENDRVIGISGVGLSTELRQKFPEVPIVLFTRRNVFNIHNYRKILGTVPSIDGIVYKQDVFKTESTVLDELYNLAIGYQTLRDQKHRSWSDLMKLLGALQIDSELLKQSSPPFFYGARWAAASIAPWIRGTVLRFPGVLYNQVHAATFLGISKEVFLSQDIQDKFIQAKYSGIFASPEGRWWKSKLSTIAYSFMGRKEKELPLRYGFPAVWERKNGVSINRAKCIFSGESPADWVCHILEQPVMIKYSLSYAADDRPAVMDEARVSFEAIRTSNDFDDKLVDPLGRELIANIRGMQKPGEASGVD